MSSKDEFTRYLISAFGDWEGVRREFRRFGRHDESEIERFGKWKWSWLWSTIVGPCGEVVHRGSFEDEQVLQAYRIEFVQRNAKSLVSWLVYRHVCEVSTDKTGPFTYGFYEIICSFGWRFGERWRVVNGYELEDSETDAVVGNVHFDALKSKWVNWTHLSLHEMLDYLVGKFDSWDDVVSGFDAYGGWLLVEFIGPGWSLVPIDKGHVFIGERDFVLYELGVSEDA